MGVAYSELLGSSASVNRLAVANSSNRPDKNRFTSLFEKYGKTGENGTPLKIRPHQLRHWVNTLAARGGAAGGMTLVEMSLWFGRRDLDETLQYVHLDLPARIRWLEREIEAGSVAGPFIDAVRSITDPEQRRAFIRLHAGRVHITPYGLCIHDFDAQPCPYHLVCVKGCKMFIRIKGRQEQRRNIEALLAFEEEKIAQFAGDGAAENWIIDAKETRDGCLRALAVDEDETVANGTPVRVFPEARYSARPWSERSRHERQQQEQRSHGKKPYQ
jgi:hypothetical protein